MQRFFVALGGVVLGFSIGATSAWAHGPHGHGKVNAEQCKRILDPDVQSECIACVAQDGRAFFPGAQGKARCAPRHDHR